MLDTVSRVPFPVSLGPEEAMAGERHTVISARRKREMIRGIVTMAGCAILFNVFPIKRQVMGTRSGVFAAGWGMYHGAGYKTCDLRYYDAPAGTPRQYVKRWELLGAARPTTLSKGDARVGRGGLKASHDRVCRAYRERADPSSGLFPEVRCASRPRKDGWEVILDGTVDVCAPRKPQTQASPPSRRRKR